jgi:hypothetical protein
VVVNDLKVVVPMKELEKAHHVYQREIYKKTTGEYAPECWALSVTAACTSHFNGRVQRSSSRASDCMTCGIRLVR